MANKSCTLFVEGMHCDSCELYLESVIKKHPGVKTVTAHSNSQTVSVEYEDSANITDITTEINKIVKPRGYVLRTVQVASAQKVDVKSLLIAFVCALVLVGLFWYSQRFNVAAFYNPEKLTYVAVFVLGLVASLTTCMAVVGGLVLSLSASLEKNKQRAGIIAFHVGRIIGFLILGGMIGGLGKMVVVNGSVATLLKLVVALLMMVISLDLLGVKLPKLVMPKSISSIFDVFSDKDGVLGAVSVGVATFFLPCAFTQSMQVAALSSGSVVNGALIMFIFALGTFPALALLSLSSIASVGTMKKGIFHYTTAFVMLFLSMYSVAIIASVR